jgi:hypothetical protein
MPLQTSSQALLYALFTQYFIWFKGHIAFAPIVLDENNDLLRYVLSNYC